MYLPSGEPRMAVHLSSRDVKFGRGFPVAVSQLYTFPSLQAANSVLPSSENSTAKQVSVGPVNRNNSFQFRQSYSNTLCDPFPSQFFGWASARYLLSSEYRAAMTYSPGMGLGSGGSGQSTV